MDTPTKWSYSEPFIYENTDEKSNCQDVEHENTKSVEKKEEPPAARRKRLTKQILLISMACFAYVSVGMALVWPNVLASHIMKDNSTIFNTELQLDDWQMDMTGSMLFIGSVPGYLLAGWLVGSIGRRWSMLIAGIPCILGTLMIALSYNIYLLLIGRFLDGITFGMAVVSVRTYVVEIADMDIRGSACILVNIMMQCGSISILIAALFLTWYHVALMSCAIMSIYCIFIVPFVLPESPTYLAVKNRDSEALSVLLWLRGPYADLNEELEQLKKMNQTVCGKKSGFNGLWKSKIVKKLIILFGLFMISNFCGVQVLKANTVRILKASGLAFNSIVSTIIVITVIFAGNFSMMLLVDKIGRRYCLILSFTLLAVAYYALGTYNFIIEFIIAPTEVAINPMNFQEFNTTLAYENNLSYDSTNYWNWIPLVCLMVAAFGQSTGAGPLPFVLAPEYFPTNIRSQAMSLCTMMGGLQSFAALQLFSPMQDLLTNGGIYWAYAVSATIGIPYTIFIIHETSRKNVG